MFGLDVERKSPLEEEGEERWSRSRMEERLCTLEHIWRGNNIPFLEQDKTVWDD